MEQLHISNKFIFFLIIGAIISIIYGAKDSKYWGIVPKTGEEILLEVGSGVSNPSELKLSPDQYKEIKKIVQRNPKRYNDAQKSLISKKNYPEKSSDELLAEVGLGKMESKNILLTPEQFAEILSFIKETPSKFNDSQKALLYMNSSGEEILQVIDSKIFEPEDLKLTYYQRKEIKSLIDENPTKYNEFQKAPFIELSGSDVLYEIGMGKIDPKDLTISSKQFKEIQYLIQANPENYNEVQKSLLYKK